MLLEKKSAIVTGGGIGIGRAIALGLAREGADVVIAARSSAALEDVAAQITAMGRKSLAITADLLHPETPDIIVQKALDEFGKVDILVNNSGSEGPIMPVSDMDLDGWNDLIKVNLTGTMLCSRAVLDKDMIPRRSGVIVNIASLAGRGGMPNRSAYCSSKFGIIGFTQSLALETGPLGIRINAIAPGAVEGDRIERVMRKAAENAGVAYEDYIGNYLHGSALRRMVKPEEVADLAVFLASDRSSAITGQTINIDAGSIFN